MRADSWTTVLWALAAFALLTLVGLVLIPLPPDDVPRSGNVAGLLIVAGCTGLILLLLLERAPEPWRQRGLWPLLLAVFVGLAWSHMRYHGHLEELTFRYPPETLDKVAVKGRHPTATGQEARDRLEGTLGRSPDDAELVAAYGGIPGGPEALWGQEEVEAARRLLKRDFELSLVLTGLLAFPLIGLVRSSTALRSRRSRRNTDPKEPPPADSEGPPRQSPAQPVATAPSGHLFLAHNSRNKRQVRHLARQLTRRGLKVWLDEWELIPGRRWQPALEKALGEAAAVAVLVGRDGLGPWQEEELDAALREAVSRQVPVVPVLLPRAAREPELPIFLAARHYVDLRQGLTERGLHLLECGVRGISPGPPVEAT